MDTRGDSEMKCPVCGERFEDEDFCPTHGARLQAEPAEAARPKAESTAAPKGAPDGGDEDDAVSRLIKKYGVRSPKAGGATGAAAGQDHGPLPERLTQQGWVIAG